MQFSIQLDVLGEIRVGQIHRRPTRPKIRVGLVLHVLHGSGAYDHEDILQSDMLQLCSRQIGLVRLVHVRWYNRVYNILV